MSRCLIPINDNYFLILTLYDFNKIIKEKIIPFIQREKKNFVIKKDE